ncbi:MAG: ChaN family lipoprotein, partial [Nitrospirota bacterium]|nr:ChaN family lipoprotein [Nitrospirota bacterium]
MKIIAFIVLLIIGFFTHAVEAVETLLSYNLSVSFDIQRGIIRGISTVTMSESKEINISTGALKIIYVRLNGQPLEPEIKNGMFKVNIKGTLEIGYEGMFKEESGKENFENTGVITKDIISNEGISLTGMWYPLIVGIDSYREGMAYYNLKAFFPKGFTAISEADEITVSDTGQGIEYSFNFPHPLTNINLIAGKYTELKETFNGIDIYIYFFSEDISLAKTYIEYTKKYLKLYGDLLSPYPYKRFSVVENFLPTGYSMPTFTLLGQDVVRLPFIVETSLGHEVLHQWFGNLVYCGCEKGNWLEGLTTYLSDHLFEERNGKGWQYRKKLLIDYQSYVTPDKETALKDFLQRKDFASKAIGYGKGAMFFHMLKNLIGNDSFNNALKGLIKEKEFQEASWDDLKMAFEKSSGRNLGLFFDQWLTRKGLISIKIEEPRVVFSHYSQILSFEVVQQSEPYAFNLPVKIITNKGEKMEVLNIEKEREKIKIQVEGTPLEMTFDGDYNLMRRLSEAEYPPVIAKLIGDEKRLIVLPEKDREKYVELIALLKEKGFTIKEEKEIKDEDIKTSSLLILGTGSPILKRLFGEFKESGTGFTLLMKKNPLNSSKVIAIASAGSKEEVDLASKKIFHYGKYSYLRFEKGQNIEKKTDETQQGIRINLYKPVLGIQPRDAIKLDEIIQKISGTPIIYIGERHTNYEEHKIQLDIIMSLFEKGNKFAVGMEMFQKPFQKVLDDYISGKISEREFLKNSEYFKRWQFDYNLYKEIIEFAKAKNIPIIALNLRSEIIEKVSR